MKKTTNAPTARKKPRQMRLAESLEYQEDAVVSRTLIKAASGTVTLFAFGQGQELSEHTAPFDALVHVLDGTAEITIQHVPYRLETGEAIIMPADQPHALRAIERFKMLLTMIRDTSATS
jgi:quercetin dioxygenase-like cupin family protein